MPDLYIVVYIILGILFAPMIIAIASLPFLALAILISEPWIEVIRLYKVWKRKRDGRVNLTPPDRVL